MENVFGPSHPCTKNEAHKSNEDGSEIEISSAPTFSLDDNDKDEIKQPLPLDDLIMVLDDEDSSGSQHSTSKLKQKKKKKLAVFRKEFLNLQSKVDQILAAVFSKTL